MTLPDDEHWRRVEELATRLMALTPTAAARGMEDLREGNEPTVILSLLSNWLSLPVAPPPLGAGSVLAGRYTLRKQIGEGGMGSVWRATQKMIEREVAVKMIHPALATPALCGKFAGEMEILGKLEHPGIVRIFDAGIHEREDGVAIPFFAMELIEGVALHRWAPAHRHDRGRLLGVMAEICAALQHAHDRKIVHRDLKPPNILVRENGRPVVLDFGIARLAGGGTDADAGAFAGTPHYAAPEQHLGRDRDFRSGESVDVYAAGAILFEVLTGHRLFDFPRNTSILEMRRAIIEDTPPRLIDLLPDCPPLIDEIAARAVRRDPVDRYYSISALARALERAAAIETSPPDTEFPRWMPMAGALVPGTEWKLAEKLGEGGAGEVWSGANEKLGERRVFKFCDTEDKARTLKRELTLFRLLKERVGRNPHFIQLHEVSLEEAPWYLMMDFVEARNLEEWCANYPGGIEALPLGTRIEIIAQVAEALQAAHEAGILHRDVKPGNLLIATTKAEARPGEEETSKPHVFISDFGIGQIIASELLRGGTRSGFTLTVSDLRRSTLSGTMLYLAPEVLEGNGATARSDIYSLGVIFWQLLIGNLNAALDAGDWPTRISDPLLREDLHRCLAGEPAKRWLSAGDFAASLRALPERQAAETRRRAEIAAREKAAYRRGVARTAAVAAVVLLVIIATGRYAYKESAAAAVFRANARANLLTAALSQLGKLAVSDLADRSSEAKNAIRSANADNDGDRLKLGDAYTPILERDQWQITESFRRSPSAWAASDSSGQFVLRQTSGGDVEFDDLTDPKPIWTRKGVEGPPLFAVAEEGRGTAVAADRNLLILDSHTGKITDKVTLKSQVTALAWRADGKELAVGQASPTGEGEIELLSGEGWTTKRTLSKTDMNPFSRTPTGLAYSPDGKLLAHWSSESLHLLIWRPATGKLAAYAFAPSSLREAAWENDGTKRGSWMVFAAGDDASIYGWTLPANEDLYALDRCTIQFPAEGTQRQLGNRHYARLALLEGRHFIAAADDAGAAACIDLATLEPLVEIPPGSSVLTLGGNGNRAFLLKQNGVTDFFHRNESPVARTYSSGHVGPIDDFDISPDGSACAIGGAGGIVILLGDAELLPTMVVEPDPEPVSYPSAHCRGIRFLDETRLLFSDRGGDGFLRIEGKRILRESQSPSAADETRDRPACLSTDAARTQWVAGRSGRITWHASNGDIFSLPLTSDGAPVGVAMSPDGKWFAWADAANQAWLCAHDRKQCVPFPGASASRVTFVGNEHCAVESSSGVRLFAIASLKETAIAGIDPLQNTEVAAQASGTLAARAERSGGIELGIILGKSGALQWTPIVKLGVGRREVFSRLRFLGGDRWLGAVSSDGRLHLWDLAALHRELDAVSCLPVSPAVPAADFSPP